MTKKEEIVMWTTMSVPVLGLVALIGRNMICIKDITFEGRNYGVEQRENSTVIYFHNEEMSGIYDSLIAQNNGGLERHTRTYCCGRGCLSADISLTSEDQRVYQGLLTKLGETK